MIHSRRTGYYRNIGLLILRAGLGIMFVLYGYPKVFGGPETWITVGSAIGFPGLDPMFFGFMAGIIELFGGIFLILGLFFKPALVLIIVGMLFAAVSDTGSGEEFRGASHSIELGIVFFSLLFIGAGKYSLDRMFTRRKKIY